MAEPCKASAPVLGMIDSPCKPDEPYIRVSGVLPQAILGTGQIPTVSSSEHECRPSVLEMLFASPFGPSTVSSVIPEASGGFAQGINILSIQF